MLKQHKRILLITSCVILLPILAGLILWNRLPDTIATHWNIAGIADGWSSKSFAVFVLPLILLAVHWLCGFFTFSDPKKKNIGKKPLTLMFWICPIVSLFTNGMIYAGALGVNMRAENLTPTFLGILFILIGNYLPKCQQNHTFGIRIPWTLNDEENWNHTHRFSGRVWIGGGIFLLLFAVLGQLWLTLAVLPILVIAPIIYSYLYDRKHSAPRP